MGSLHNKYKEMMRRRDLWTDEMREIHARRKAAVDDCLFALADLDDTNAASSKTVCAIYSTLRMANSTRPM